VSILLITEPADHQWHGWDGERSEISTDISGPSYP
jgi:hypothetical protein